MRNKNRYGYSRRQRILAWLALIGIFICGMMAGAFIWQTKSAHTADSDINNNLVTPNEPVHSCVLLQETLLEKIIYDIDNGSRDAAELHEYNGKVYDRIAKVGCTQNEKLYKEMAESEREIAESLRIVDEKNVLDELPCWNIEKTLLSNIRDCGVGYTSECHLGNAEIYSKIAESGCPENAEKYKRLALNELQIADGVRINETDVDRSEIRSTVNTYKKLQMQNEAKKYLNKVEKLVNPGIDFIMELQRVIEE